MEIYKSQYLRLFNAITDALKLLPSDSKAAALLRLAQSDCEELYISAPSQLSES